MTQNPEILFNAVAQRNWEAALTSVHGLKSVETAVAERARAVLVHAVMDDVSRTDFTMADADLEKVILLHNVGCLELAESQLDAVAESLVARNLDQPERAARFARHRPGAPSCKAVLGQFGDPERIVGRLTQEGRRTVVESGGVSDGRRSIFRSAQERLFFQAAARTFPGKLLVPNAALNAAINFPAITEFLLESDRRLFFRVLIDLVVFDPGEDFKPTHFFELDSAWHDDPHRDDRDKRKERFITLAGCSLIRIRTTGAIGLSGMQKLLLSALSELP